MNTSLDTSSDTSLDTTGARPARRMRRALGVATLGLAALAVTVPAGIALAIPTDSVKITEQEVDFGRNWIAGAPVSSGSVSWTVGGGNVTARLFNGNLYINNASGTCARMRLEGYDANHHLVASRNGVTKCASNGSLHSWSVDLSITHPDALHVHAVLQTQTAGGGYLTAGLDTADI